jgi:cupin fold WbuC family metalloprotein
MTSLLIASNSLLGMEDVARSQARRRLHHNLHCDYSDPCQRLLNVVCSDSYIPPHCHDSSQGTETLFAIGGLFAVVMFDNLGNILSAHRMGSEKYEDGSNNLAGVQSSLGFGIR